MTILIDRSTIRKNPDYCPSGSIQYAMSGGQLIDITSMHSPRFLYRYLPTDVTCEECGATFDHSKLVDSDYSPADLCPECGEVVDVDYERLTDEMTRGIG